MKSKLFIITPVKHIKNFLNLAKKNFQISVYEKPKKRALIKNIKKFDYIFTNPNMSKIFLDGEILKNSKIKAICTASTGTNHIDLSYVKKNGIKLLSLTQEKKIIRKLSSTAELAFCLSLMGLRHINESSKSVKKGEWSYLDYVGRSLNNINILTIGYGRVGRIYSKFCMSFGANMSFYDPYVNIKSKKLNRITKLGKDLKKFDIISLNIHALKKNINFLSNRLFKYFKQDVIIINTSRGEVINEEHLLKFLKNNRKSKYLADVIKGEQRNIENNILLKEYKKQNDQIFLTPHIGGMTEQGQALAYKHALNMLIKYDKYLKKNNKFC